MATFSLRPLSLLLLCMLLLVLSLTHQSVVCLPTTDGAAPTTGPYSVAGVILHGSCSLSLSLSQRASLPADL